ncbi:MAG: methyltransferase domain-containing protein [Rubellimicrobium sp.]|nr:methyltransferase domain-containing protein [Rubellimicrobium sp.]
MTDPDVHVDEYGDEMVAFLELIWGKGFMAPGGPGNVARMVAGIGTQDRHILDIGCGIGGGDIVLASEHGARITAIDIEAPLVARARDYVDEADLSDRIEIRHVTPGKLDFADESFDIVYSAGAFTQIEDKAGMFAECLRVLRPGGILTTYDWMGTGQPHSAAMQEWFRLEGLTYNLGSLPSHRRLLTEAGFTDVSVVDDGGWYAAEARRELALLQGPLEKEGRALIGDDTYRHYIEDWVLLVRVLDDRELIPGYLRGVKPAV